MPNSSFRASERGAPPVLLTRRRVGGLVGGGLAAMLLGGCGKGPAGAIVAVSGSAPPLAFTMRRASDGKEVSAADYAGRVVMLYLGYTYCPDACPMTLANITTVLGRLGEDADRVRVLFVTVDPRRDTLEAMADYVSSFAPQIDALRGTPDQLAALARRYRLVYSVTPGKDGQPYLVSHSAAVYVFDRGGAARLLLSSLASDRADLEGTASALARLAAEPVPTSFWSRLARLV